MLKELVEYLVKSLVDKPELVSIDQTQEGEKLTFKITVGEQDYGRIIGKEGQTIRSIRALVMALSPEGQFVTIDIAR